MHSCRFAPSLPRSAFHSHDLQADRLLVVLPVAVSSIDRQPGEVTHTVLTRYQETAIGGVVRDEHEHLRRERIAQDAVTRGCILRARISIKRYINSSYIGIDICRT